MTLSEAQATAILAIALRPSPLWLRASPNYSNHLLDVPCSVPRWIDSVLSVGIGARPRRALPNRMAFPERTAGRHPQISFRGLLELHSRYGPPICSPTYPGLLSRG